MTNTMNEKTWMTSVLDLLNTHIQQTNPSLEAQQSTRLPYAFEISSYNASQPAEPNLSVYETDLLIIERLPQDQWKPRVVIEGKLGRVTTHDAITYSEKARSHKSVHPYLRYGILLGGRGTYPLPGRLYRHGVYFDFMLSWVKSEPDQTERETFLRILLDEVEASRCLEEMLFKSRCPNRKTYTVLHRPLRLG